MASMENAMNNAMQLSGAIAVAVVDLESGMCLGQAGGNSLNLDVAAAGNTEVMRAKLNTMRELGLNTEIEDILITLGTQYHIIRPIRTKGGAGLFLYLALDRTKGNLALSRHKLTEIERTITI